MPQVRTTRPPPAANLLCDAIDQAAATVALPTGHYGQAVTLTFGAQTDTRPVHRDTIIATGKPLDADAVANYIAKYGTKTLTAPGVPDTASGTLPRSPACAAQPTPGHDHH